MPYMADGVTSKGDAQAMRQAEMCLKMTYGIVAVKVFVNE